MGLNKSEYQDFAIIIGDGSIRVQAQETDEGAILRKYKTQEGVEKEKWEMKYKSLDGIIEQIKIVDSQFGKNLQIKIDGIYLSLGISSNFASDIMKKLPNINLEKKIEFCPYSFTDKTGKLRKGVTVLQDENKIENFFYDMKEKKALYDFPEFPKDYKKFDSEDWKAYFIGVSKFLQKYLTENIIPKVEEKITKKAVINTFGGKEKELDAEDIPM